MVEESNGVLIQEIFLFFQIIPDHYPGHLLKCLILNLFKSHLETDQNFIPVSKETKYEKVQQLTGPLTGTFIDVGIWIDETDFRHYYEPGQNTKI